MTVWDETTVEDVTADVTTGAATVSGGAMLLPVASLTGGTSTAWRGGRQRTLEPMTFVRTGEGKARPVRAGRGALLQMGGTCG